MKNLTKVICLLCFVTAVTFCCFAQNQLPKPDLENVKYGLHERNVFDVWFAKSAQPTPLVIYIHGGGFKNGDKKSLKLKTLNQLLDAGISVAAVNYRFLEHAPLPAAHEDCKKALQYMRHNATEWNIDKKRVGAFGGSAGAQICMWLAFTDDMANPQAFENIDKESTRLTCVATNGGQTTLDFDLWVEWIPGYDKPHVDLSGYSDPAEKAAYKEEAKKLSAMILVSKDDPPLFMVYGMKPDAAIPENPKKTQGWKIHHVIFGIKLKEKMDKLGVEAHLKYPGTNTEYASIEEFFQTKLFK